MKEFKNPVILDAVPGARPSHDNACAGCVHSVWYRDMHSTDLHCFCKLCSVESWNTRRGLHCVRLCVGRDVRPKRILASTNDESKNSACVMCKDAVWWRDDKDACYCYCKPLFRLTAGYTANGTRIQPKMDCNGIRPADDVTDGR